MADPNRFSIPVIEFVTQLMKERFPALSVSRGSPFYQTFILPMAEVLQPFRDRVNVIKRNQSLRNYAVMDEDEMDRAVSNFLVDRTLGSRSYGVQRVFFNEIRAVYIDITATFLDDSDHRWRPSSPISLTEIELAQYVITETGEYYVDVPVVAETDGQEYRAAAGQVNRFSNIPGAVRTTNLFDYFSGSDLETNTNLYTRTRQSISNQDLVKSDAIIAAIKTAFPTVRDVKVIGYGDQQMIRDSVEAVVSIDQVLRFSYCRKVNLPLNEAGEVTWYDDAGHLIIAPVGGYVAAIADLTGIDFNSVLVSSSYDAATRISVQPGFRVQLYEGYSGDPDVGEFLVTRVEEVSVDPGGPLVKIVRLDRPFSDPQISTWNPATDFEKYSYTVLGGVSTKNFHVGGKVDVYVDSTADEEDSVIVGYLPETAPGVAEVPVEDTNPTNPETALPLFENGKPFRLPALNILKVEQVDYEDENKVERELIAGVHYVLVRAESRGRYTRAPTDMLIIKGFEDDGITPAFSGRRMKITYTTNQDIPLVQVFVADPARKNVKCDMLVRAKRTAIVDIELTYEGTTAVTDVQAMLEEYIKGKGFGSTVSADDVVTLLRLFGVTKVVQPIQIHLRRDVGDGTTQSEVSEDSVTTQDDEVPYPAATLTVTQA